MGADNGFRGGMLLARTKTLIMNILTPGLVTSSPPPTRQPAALNGPEPMHLELRSLKSRRQTILECEGWGHGCGNFTHSNVKST